MPKLTECFSPITKPSLENPLVSSNVATPVPIYANSTCNTPLPSNEHSLSNSPSRLSDTETYRTIVSMFINQRKTRLDLEEQLKHLQSSIKPTSLDEHQTHSFSNYRMNIKKMI